MTPTPDNRTRTLPRPPLPRAAPPKLPVGWSRNGLPLVPEYERGDG